MVSSTPFTQNNEFPYLNHTGQLEHIGVLNYIISTIGNLVYSNEQ